MSDVDANLIQNSYQMCYVKKVFLKFSYNSLENTYFEASLVAEDQQLCYPHMHKWVSGDTSTVFSETSFIQKMPESSDSMYSFIFMLENI